MIIYFWRDIVRIIGKWFRHFFVGNGAYRDNPIPKGDPDVRLGWLIIIGTIPIVVVGFLAQEYIRSVFRSLWLVAIVLIVFGIILGIADRLGRKTRTIEEITYPHGLAIGVAQMLALVPGVLARGDDDDGPRPRLHARGGREVRLPARDPAVFGSGLYELVHSFGGRRATTATPRRLRDGHHLRRRARRHRLPHALAADEVVPAVRDLPARARRRAHRAARARRPQPY